MRKSLTVFLVCAAVLGCAGLSPPVEAQESKPKLLTGAELKTLFSKKRTVRSSGAGLRSLTTVYEPDGTARIEDPNVTLLGSWRIEDNKFCTNYTMLGSGCFHLGQTGENTYQTVPIESDQPGRKWEILN